MHHQCSDRERCGYTFRNGVVMDTLTTEQRAQLDALLAHLETFPTPELILESGKLRCPPPLDDKGKKRLGFAFAGAVAAEKILSYITTLDELDAHRLQIGRKIAQL